MTYPHTRCARCHLPTLDGACRLCQAEGHLDTWTLDELLVRRPGLSEYRAKGRDQRGHFRQGRCYVLDDVRLIAAAERRYLQASLLNLPDFLGPDSVTVGSASMSWVQSHSGLPSLSSMLAEFDWSQTQILRFGRSLFERIAELHAGGLVHGDINLESVLVRWDRIGPMPVISHLPPVLLSGWSPHAAPEIQCGRSASSLSDIFGGGYVVASLLAGAPLDGLGRHHSWLEGSSGPVDLPVSEHSLLPFVLPLIARHPADRPQNAWAVAKGYARAMGELAAA